MPRVRRVRKSGSRRRAERRDQQANTTGQIGPTNQTDQIGPTNQTDQIGPTNQTDQIGPTNHTDQIGPTNQTDQIGPTNQTDQTDQIEQTSITNANVNTIPTHHAAGANSIWDAKSASHGTPGSQAGTVDGLPSWADWFAKQPGQSSTANKPPNQSDQSSDQSSDLSSDDDHDDHDDILAVNKEGQRLRLHMAANGIVATPVSPVTPVTPLPAVSAATPLPAVPSTSDQSGHGAADKPDKPDEQTLRRRYTKLFLCKPRIADLETLDSALDLDYLMDLIHDCCDDREIDASFLRHLPQRLVCNHRLINLVMAKWPCRLDMVLDVLSEWLGTLCDPERAPRQPAHDLAMAEMLYAATAKNAGQMRSQRVAHNINFVSKVVALNPHALKYTSLDLTRDDALILVMRTMLVDPTVVKYAKSRDACRTNKVQSVLQQLTPSDIDTFIQTRQQFKQSVLFDCGDCGW